METQDQKPSEDRNIDSLIHFLDTEIELTDNKHKRPGWTIWAVGGSMAGLFWLLLSELEQGLFSLPVLFASLIVISFSLDFIEHFKRLLDSSSQEIKGRFVITNRLSKRRLTVVLNLFRYSAVLYFIYSVSTNIDGIVLAVSYVAGAWSLLAFVLILVLSFLKIPLPTNQLRRVAWTEKLIPFTLMLVTAYIVIGYLQIVLSSAGVISNIRVGVLIASMYYLLVLASDISVESPLLSSLIDIRRELSLGRLDYQVAIEQLDIVIGGLKLADVLQEYIGTILKLFEEFNGKMEQSAIHLAAIKKIISEVQDKASDEQAATIKSLSSSLHKILLEAKEISGTKLPHAMKPFSWRISMIKTFADVTEDELFNVQRSIQMAIGKAGHQLDVLYEELQHMSDEFTGEIDGKNIIKTKK